MEGGRIGSDAGWLVTEGTSNAKKGKEARHRGGMVEQAERARGCISGLEFGSEVTMLLEKDPIYSTACRLTCADRVRGMST